MLAHAVLCICGQAALLRVKLCSLTEEIISFCPGQPSVLLTFRHQEDVNLGKLEISTRRCVTSSWAKRWSVGEAEAIHVKHNS